MDKLPKTWYPSHVVFYWAFLKGLAKWQRRAAKALVIVPTDFSVVLPGPEATTSVSPSSFWRVPEGTIEHLHSFLQTGGKSHESFLPFLHHTHLYDSIP